MLLNGAYTLRPHSLNNTTLTGYTTYIGGVLHTLTGHLGVESRAVGVLLLQSQLLIS